MRLRFFTLDVFTDRALGGNALAVIPDAAKVPEASMQAVAREFNLSETVFVLPPDDPRHTCRLRIFTPQSELPFAGHPTIGAAHLLALLGRVNVGGGQSHAVFEEGVGPVRVLVRGGPEGPTFAQLSSVAPPAEGPSTATDAEIARVLSIPPESIGTADGWRPAAYSCGVPFLFVPVRDRAALARVRLARDAWRATLADSWAPQLYVFTPDGGGDAAGATSFRARMFAPGHGIEEDPATGGAAVAFAGYLARWSGALDAGKSGTLRWRVEQGVEMGRPSVLRVEAELEDGRLRAAKVGGASVLVSEGHLYLS